MQEITEVMQQTLQFETWLIENFETSFEDILNRVFGDNFAKLKPIAYDKLSPIQIKLGYLKSDFRAGVAKFFNLSHSFLQT